MSQLGTILDLPEGTRLTGITIHPLDELWLASTAVVHLQVFRPSERADPATCAGAVSAFLPATYADLYGTMPEGEAWVAILLVATQNEQMGPVFPDERTAFAPLRRALDLTGIPAQGIRQVPMTERALQRLYERAGAEIDAMWSIPDLLLGLLVELTNMPLAEVIDRAEQSGPAGSTGPGSRAPDRDRLVSLLAEWASTVDGPVL